MTEAFHERLRRLRTEKGLTMRALAEQVQVPETTYREWEKGRSIQGQPYIALASVLGISLHELLTGEKSGQNELVQALEGLESAIRTLRHRIFAQF